MMTLKTKMKKKEEGEEKKIESIVMYGAIRHSKFA